MSKDNSEPAFPAPAASIEHYGRSDGYTGMSLRDYFAGQALAGMFANDAMITRYGAHAKDNLIDPDVITATAAYSIADAMISERSK